MRKFLSLLLPVVLSLLSCQKWGGGEKPPLKIVLTQSEGIVAKYANRGAFTLLELVHNSPERVSENMMISPLSLNIAMAMCRNGAVGETQRQIEEGLQMGDGVESINSYFQKMSSQLTKVDKKSTLHIANSIWYHNNFLVKESFLTTNGEWFNAQISTLDFSSPQTLNTINSWCSRETNGKIESILEEISPLEVMFMINALYFKAPWSKKFKREHTQPQSFYLANGEEIKVPTMNGNVKGAIFQEGEVKALTIPFGNGAFNFTVALSNTIPNTISTLKTTELWDRIASNSTLETVDLYLPKFKFESEINFNDILKALGVVDAFDSQKANFSEIVEGATAGELVISKVLQKTYIAIDEEGGEAAAATSVGMGLTAAPQEPLTFRVERPFLFLIWEHSTSTILFAGEVGNPAN
ncbi:MAG: serpin family protein [Bacteroidales bacterium]